MEVKKILSELVRYNTICDYQNNELMNFIEDYLKKYDFTVKRVKKCLIAYNDLKPNIGFIGHTDTVDYESWDGSPFELKEDHGKLIALGACDMKGGIAAILAAIALVDLTKNKLAIYLTNDEEIGFSGIKDLQSYIISDTVIIGEPTNNIPVYGTKGVLELEILFYGVKCHSSTPNKGENAIYHCINFIGEIRKYYEEVLKKQENTSFDIPYTTMNIGMINGGETVNSVPGKCRITIDFRIVYSHQISDILDTIYQLLASYRAELSVKNSVFPKINLNDISFLEKISSKKETKCYITEGSFIDKNFIILGPGPDTSHQKGEYIMLSSLQKTVQIYKKIIEFYNGGDDLSEL